MSNLSNVLDVAIGLIFVFGLLSLVATWVQEIIARVFDWRAKFLLASIKNLLTTDDLDNAKLLKSARLFIRAAWGPLQDGNLTMAATQLRELSARPRPSDSNRAIEEIVGEIPVHVEKVKSELHGSSPSEINAISGELKTIDNKVHLAEKQLGQSQLQNLYALVYSHPIIKGLAEPGKQPSYIPSREFANALLDILMKAGTSAESPTLEFLDKVEAGIKQVQGNDDTKDALQALVTNVRAGVIETENNVAAVRDSIAQWFDESMKRASGWYKRQSQWIALWVGIGVALIFNTDTLAMAQALWRDPALRETWSNQAVAYVTNKDESNAQQALEKISAVNFPIGWSLQSDPASPIGFWLLQDDADPKTPVNPQKFPGTLLDGVLKLIGIIFTGFAISQGAPIWFDLLGKLVNMRQTGIKPETATGSG
jgi:hypothetical protein